MTGKKIAKRERSGVPAKAIFGHDPGPWVSDDCKFEIRLIVMLRNISELDIFPGEEVRQSFGAPAEVPIFSEEEARPSLPGFSQTIEEEHFHALASRFGHMNEYCLELVYQHIPSPISPG